MGASCSSGQSKGGPGIRGNLCISGAVTARPGNRSSITEVADAIHANIVGMGEDKIILEVVGSARHINSIVQLLSPFGIENIARTRVVVLAYRSQIPPIN